MLGERLDGVDQRTDGVGVAGAVGEEVGTDDTVFGLLIVEEVVTGRAALSGSGRVGEGEGEQTVFLFIHLFGHVFDGGVLLVGILQLSDGVLQLAHRLLRGIIEDIALEGRLVGDGEGHIVCQRIVVDGERLVDGDFKTAVGETCADVLALVDQVKERVLQQTGVELEMEVRVLR